MGVYGLLTLIQFEIRHGLPFVGGDEPLVVFAAARQVDDQLVLVVVEGGEHGVQTVHAEDAVGEEVGCYDDLLRLISSLLLVCRWGGGCKVGLLSPV